MKKIKIAVLAASALLMAANAAATTVRVHYKVAKAASRSSATRGR